MMFFKKIVSTFVLAVTLFGALSSFEAKGVDFIKEGLTQRGREFGQLDTFMSHMFEPGAKDPGAIVGGYLTMLQKVDADEFGRLLKNPDRGMWYEKLGLFSGVGVPLTTEKAMWRQVLDALTKGRDALDAYAKSLVGDANKDNRIVINDIIDEINFGMAKIIGGSFRFEARPAANYYEKLHFLARAIVGIGQHMDEGNTPRIMTKGFVSPGGMDTPADQWHVILAKVMVLIAQNPSLDHKTYTALMASYASPAVNADQYIAVYNYLAKQNLLPKVSRCAVKPIARALIESDIPDVENIQRQIYALYDKHQASLDADLREHIKQTLRAMFAIGAAMKAGTLEPKFKAIYDRAKRDDDDEAREFVSLSANIFENVQRRVPNDKWPDAQKINKYYVFESVEYIGLNYGDLPEWEAIRDQILRTHLYDGPRHMATFLKILKVDPTLEKEFFRSAFSSPDLCLPARNTTMNKWVGLYKSLYLSGNPTRAIYKAVIKNRDISNDNLRFSKILKLFQAHVMKQLKVQVPGKDFAAMTDEVRDEDPDYKRLYNLNTATDWMFDTIQKAYMAQVGQEKDFWRGIYTKPEMEREFANSPYSTKAKVRAFMDGIYFF